MTIYTFDHAQEIIEGQLKRGFDKKKVANNTYLQKENDNFVIQLHNTNVITITQDSGETFYSLTAKEYRTATTKDRINNFSPARIYQKRGVWFIQNKDTDTPFFDGITVNRQGEVVNADAVPGSLIESEKRLDRMISKYIRGFAKDAIENGLQDPGNGDCLMCRIYTESPENDDCEHIFSHMQEDYYVPSLLFYALKLRGYRDPAFYWTVVIKRDIENNDDSTLKRELRYFFGKKKHQLLKFIEL